MKYQHITLSLSLEGLSPLKLVSNMKKEGFQPLYSELVTKCCDFLCEKDPFKKYKKITTVEKKRGVKPTTSTSALSYIVWPSEESSPPSFGELFRHKKYPDLTFSLIDTSAPDEHTTWFCCWTPKNKDTLEPLEFFMTTVLKAIGCDRSLEEIKQSDTFSLAHSRTVKKLKEYKLRKASVREKKSTFRLISDPKIRDILIEFNKKNSILLSDFLDNKKEEQREELKLTLNFLSGQGLLDKKLIVICNETGQWWNMTIPSVTKLKELEKSGITCASCGAKITEEKTDDLFRISPKGRKLVSGSYWMVDQVVEVLQRLGMREEDTFVNITYNGEEIDILGLFMSNMFIFELKDKEFGLGDAYKFHGKVSRLSEKIEESIIPIVITTQNVATEARRLLSEVTTGTRSIPLRRPLLRPRDYLFVEGLNETEHEMKRLFDEIIKQAVSQRKESITGRFPAIALKEMEIV